MKRQTIEKYTPPIQATAALIIGLLVAWYVPLSALLHRAAHEAAHPTHIAHSLLPPLIAYRAAAITVVAGAILSYTAYYLLQRKHAAYWLALSLLAILVVTNVELMRAPSITIVAIGLTVWLAVSRRLYPVRSSGLHVSSTVFPALFLVLFAVLFGVASLSILSQGKVNMAQTVEDTLNLMSGVTINETPYHQVRILHEISHLVFALGVIAAVTIVIGLFRPIRFAFASGDYARSRVRALIQQHATSSEDFLKLWPHDKHYYFNLQQTAALAYGITGGSVIILGAPIGPEGEKIPLIRQFMEFCKETGWQIVAINLSAADKQLYKEAGLKNELFVGNEAYIDTDTFVHETIRSKHFRYVMNRAKKQGMSVEFWNEPTADQLTELEHISRAWMSEGGRKEFAFFMSPFQRQYLSECVIAVVRQNGLVIAYANILPQLGSSDTGSIDHMRSIPGSDQVVMHYLLANIVKREHEAGRKFFTLGLSPLSKRGDDTEQMKLVLRLAKRFGSRFYGFEGLSQFKNKFEPDWRPQYIAYSGASTGYLLALRDIDRISQVNAQLIWRLRVTTVLGLAIVVIIYVYAF